jgi:hypothetical protein
MKSGDVTMRADKAVMNQPLFEGGIADVLSCKLHGRLNGLQQYAPDN